MCKTMCRTCGQPLPSQRREGVYLPATKAQIFDFIDRHPGVAAEGVLAHCFPDRKENSSGLRLVYTHVSQINDMLAATDVRIGGWRGEYRIQRGTEAPIVRPPPKRLRVRSRTAFVPGRR